MNLRGGWPSRLLLSSWFGPGVSSLQGPLSASPGSFRGTFSSMYSILWMEPGWGRNGALLVSGQLGSPTAERWLRPGPLRPTWTTQKRATSRSLRGQTGTKGPGGGGTRDQSEVEHWTRNKDTEAGGPWHRAGARGRPLPLPAGRPPLPKRPPQARSGSLALTFSLVTGPLLPSGRCGRAVSSSGRTTAAGRRGREAGRGRTVTRRYEADPAITPARDARGPRWESPRFENKPLPVSWGNGAESRAGPGARSPPGTWG